jgi:hypothetical protein
MPQNIGIFEVHGDETFMRGCVFKDKVVPRVTGSSLKDIKYVDYNLYQKKIKD